MANAPADIRSQESEAGALRSAAITPPNGGPQAWLQVLGAHFLFFNSWGLVNTFGVFQSFYQTSLLSTHSASEISWIGTFQAFLLVPLSLVAGPIFDRGYIRWLIVVGTLLTVLGTMMTSLAREYWQVFLAQGLCVGLGTGLLLLPSVAIVATYFTTKRALAIGVVAAGGSVGSVIYPVMFHRLEPRIGFAWPMRVVGFVVLATLLVSISILRSRLPPAQKSRALLDLQAFKYLPFSLFSVGLFLAFAGLYVPIFYIIIYAQRHVHVGTDLSFYLLAILNGASVLGRIIPGLLADKYGALEITIAFTISSAVVAFVGQVITSLAGLVVFAVIYGFLSGAVVSLPSAVVAKLAPNIGIVGTWMGMFFCFAAAGILVGSPIAGTIIQERKNYFAGGFTFSGSLIAGAGLCFAAAEAIIALDEDRKQESQKTERSEVSNGY